MKAIVVTFKKEGFDESLDYIKGICIILVVLTHCMPDVWRNHMLFSFWGGTAVPQFLIIQVYHAYKKGIDHVKFNFVKLWKRVIWPFVAIELIIISLLFLLSKMDYLSILAELSEKWGIGPGSYYPWIYIQFAIILPVLSVLLRRSQNIILWIVIAELIEVFCCLVEMPDSIYRLLFLRYFFLIYLGWELADKGFILNKKTIIVACASLLATIFILYSKLDLTPVFFSHTHWSYSHWICYFFMTYFIFIAMRISYDRIKSNKFIIKAAVAMGKASYEIFLFQMLFFSVFANDVKSFLDIINIPFIKDFMFVVISLIVCITIPVIYKKMTNVEKKA